MLNAKDEIKKGLVDAKWDNDAKQLILVYDNDQGRYTETHDSDIKTYRSFNATLAYKVKGKANKKKNTDNDNSDDVTTSKHSDGDDRSFEGNVSWKPASLLTLDQKNKDVEIIWAKNESANIQKKLAEHYEFATQNDINNPLGKPTINDTENTGNLITRREMVAMKMSKKMWAAKAKYHEDINIANEIEARSFEVEGKRGQIDKTDFKSERIYAKINSNFLNKE